MNRERLNPIDLIRYFWPAAKVDHISFDPNLKGQYFRGGQLAHDGTLLFTHQILQETLLPFVNKTTHHKSSVPNGVTEIRDIKYTLGWLRLVSTMGGKHPHKMRERCRVRAACEYIL